MSGFNPDHHPILDLPPHEFVRKANAAGIKVASRTGVFDQTTSCGCALGAAAVMADRDTYLHDRRSMDVLGLKAQEWEGIVHGFEGHSVTLENQHLGLVVGYQFGSAVRAAALEIQGDLLPVPLTPAEA